MAYLGALSNNYCPLKFRIEDFFMAQIETMVPVVLGGSLGFLALIGILEFIKESSRALKKTPN